jgi:hypothetical protein
MPEDDPFDVVGPKFARRGVVGLAVLLSTLMSARLNRGKAGPTDLRKHAIWRVGRSHS